MAAARLWAVRFVALRAQCAVTRCERRVARRDDRVEFVVDSGTAYR